MMPSTHVLVRSCAVFLLCIALAESGDQELDRHGVRQPTKCEVCKFLVTELQGRLKETKSREVIETGYALDGKKKRIKYADSELRLMEALTEPHICEKILQYNVHAERKGSLRYAKGRSETMETLHGLVHKGVKVELGIPYELWDKPSAEVTIMQRQCYKMVEDFEEDIEEWYYHHQDLDISKYICKDRILPKNDLECLGEVFSGKNEDKEEDTKTPEKKEKKKDKKKKDKKVKVNLKGDTGSSKLKQDQKPEKQDASPHRVEL